ncbi:MAG TPA: hypothetical protein VHB79_23665 [Polyangiaceae bacterium]|nr:hypothetical protein [Polyangiaceae bacterium]
MRRPIASILVAASLSSLAATACRSDAPSAQRLFVAEHSYHYDVKYESTATLHQAGAGSFKLALISALDLDVLRVQGSEVELGLAFSSPALSINDSTQDPTLAQLQSDLSKPSVFVLRDGKITAERFAPELSPIVVSLERSVAAALQVPEAPRNATEWTVQELDSTGRYRARYTFDRSSNVLAKVKLGFEELLTSGKLANVDQSKLLPKIESSRVTLTLKDGELSSIIGKERLVTDVLKAPLTSESTLSLRLASQQGKLKLARAAVFAATEEMSPTHAYGTTPRRGAFDNLRADSRSFDQLVADLLEIPSDHVSETFASKNGVAVSEAEQLERKAALHKRTGSFSALVVSLRQKPENLAKAEALVLAGSKAAPHLLDALGSAGTPEAQDVLARLIQDERVPNELRGVGATSFMLVEQPTIHTSQVLESLISDPLLHDFGIYGTGTASRYLREQGNAKRADELVQNLVTLLRNADAPARRIAILRGIANSASDGALDAARAYLDAEPLEVRRAAVDALRLMKSDDVDGLLATRIIEDKSASVRLAAVKVASRRRSSPALRKAVARAVLRDADETVRVGLVELLTRWLPTDADLRPTLEQVARRDAAARVRDVAAAALKKT